MQSEESKLFNTQIKGTYNISQVYEIPIVISNSGYENVDFKDLEKPIIDGKDPI